MNNEDLNATKGKLVLIDEVVNRKDGQIITIEQMRSDILKLFLLISS